MHIQLLSSLTSISLTLSFTLVTVPVAARNFHRGVEYSAHNHNHKRLASHVKPAAVRSEVNHTVDVMKRIDDPGELLKRDGTKYVFMHHIVGNTFPYTLQDWKDDISAIQSKGVDALALNIGADDWQRTQVSSAYAAAQSLGTAFKLFISFDLTEMPCSVLDVVSRVTEHAAHPNQFLVNGKPMISSYSGDCFGDAGWGSIKAQTNGYLMPFIWGLEGSFGNWPSLDSWYCWGCAWPQGNYDKNTDDDNYYISQLGPRYATTISGWFYTHYTYKNSVLRSDDWLLNARWEQLVAMRAELTYIEMVTWNDYGESDYFGPIKGAQPAGTTWADNFPHAAWFDMSQYYITAFKTGAYPAITQDVIYYWARPHAASASASADSIGPPSGSTWTQDYLWAAVFATDSCTVTLTTGIGSQPQSQTFPLPAGVSKIKMPLSPGGVAVSMVRGGSTVVSASPTDFVFGVNPETYNYNAWVGSASAVSGNSSANSTNSTTSSTSTSANSSTPTTVSSPTNNSTSAPTISIPTISLPTISIPIISSIISIIPIPTSTSSSTPTSTTSTPPSPSPGWTYLGCYIDPNSPRVLSGFHNSLTTQTVASCLATCQGKGFAFGGTEFGKECWCGADVTAGSRLASAGDCSTACAGKASDICGGGNRISLYQLSASSDTTTSITPTTATPTTTTTTSPTATSPVTGWTYVGCYIDPLSPRVLSGFHNSLTTQTVASCLATCQGKGFAYGGTEFGKECWCGASITSGSRPANAADCSTPCAGKSTDICGGGDRISLYRASSAPPPTKRRALWRLL